MISDLRGYLELLEREGELLHIDERRSPIYEIPALIDSVNRLGGPALFFHQVEGHRFPVVANLLGTRRRLALAFGVEDERDLAQEYLERRQGLQPPVRVEGAPVQEVVLREGFEAASLLPVLTHHQRDIGPYLTCGLLIARNPETGICRMGLHRVRLTEGNGFRVIIASPGMSRVVAAAEKRGEGLEVAIVLGVDPLTFLASVAPAPEGVDKFEVAGALAGRPLALARCRSVDLQVPANAELVLEGRLLPHQREKEGPFGDSDGRYHVMEGCVGQIELLTHRAAPIYPALMPFTREDDLLIDLSWGPELLRGMRQAFPQVKRVKVSMIGYHVLLQVERASEGEVSEMIERLRSLNPPCRLAIVVGPDVEVEDPRAVEWAIAARCQPERDVRVGAGFWSIDATRSLQEDDLGWAAPPADARRRAREMMGKWLGERDGEDQG